MTVWCDTFEGVGLCSLGQSYWNDEKLAKRERQDEPELYELLDLDAEVDLVEDEADETLNDQTMYYCATYYLLEAERATEIGVTQRAY